MVNCWPACAVAGQPSVACAAPLSAGRPPTAMPSVRTTPKVVTRARMSPASFSVGCGRHRTNEVLIGMQTGCREDATDEPHVALRHPEGVADVAGAVAVHVARLGLRRAHLQVDLAWAAAGSPACIVPVTVPGGNPVTAVPGLPRDPR